MSDTTVTTVAPTVTPSLAGAVEPVKVADPAVVVDPAKAADPVKVADPVKIDPAKPVVEAAPAPFALDKVKLPEGMKADDPNLKSFGDVLADDKLSPADRGQKLLDLYADLTKKGRDAATDAWAQVNKTWADTTLADKDIGGTKWPATKTTIAKAIDSLGPDLAAGFREALDVTGAGNHPAVTKALHAFASKLTEGTHIGGNPPGQQMSIKDAFYPNSPDMK